MKDYKDFVQEAYPATSDFLVIEAYMGGQYTFSTVAIMYLLENVDKPSFRDWLLQRAIEFKETKK